MPNKYKNDLARCFATLKIDYHWKEACENPAIYFQIVATTVNELKENVYGSLDDKCDSELQKTLHDFLLEYGCPYSKLMDVLATRDLSSVDDRMILLRYLCTEVLANRRLAGKQLPNENDMSTDEHDESVDLSPYLLLCCRALNISPPSSSESLESVLNTVVQSVTSTLKRCPPGHMGNPLLSLKGLSDRQWSQVSRIAALMQQEYAARRTTMLKRLDVTIQSFKWSNKAKSNLEAIAAVYHPIRAELSQTNSYPGIPELLAVRDNMVLRLEKTSGSRARAYTACELNKILIGEVPDRGGRAWELEPPPREMPGFQQRQPDRGRGGFGAAGGGRGRGRPDGQWRGGRGGGAGDFHGGGHHGGGGRGGVGGGTSTPYGAPPSAVFGGANYVVTPADMAGLNQQMYGLAFEPGMGIGQFQGHGYVFQTPNVVGTGDFYAANSGGGHQYRQQAPGPPFRGRGRWRGRGGQ